MFAVIPPLLTRRPALPVRWKGEAASRALTGACIVAALVFAPLAFGASEPWACSILAVLAYTALAAAAARCVFERKAGPFATWLLVPLVLGLALIGLQRVPWPSGLLSVASPRALAAYADASATMGSELPQRISPSLYPHGTSLALLRFSSYVALFAATCSYVRGLREIALLGTVVFAVGFAAALLGILQSLSGADKIYWLRGTSHGAFFGPFAGRNQYAAYAALCTFVGVGLLLTRASRWNGLEQSRTEWLVEHGPQVLLLVFAIGLVGASVAWSLSRAGTLSMLLGFSGVFGAVASVRPRARHWALVAACFCATLAVITALGWGRVIERLSTLEEIARDPTATWRWQMFGDAARLGRDFPVLGVGAGAFPSVYPLYRTIPTSALVESPHNEYLHVFAEAGAPGLLLTLAGLVIAFTVVIRALRAPRQPALAGFAAGGLGAMVALSAHSLADYPMRSPAVAATAAVVLAMLCRTGPVGLPGRACGASAESLDGKGRQSASAASAARALRIVNASTVLGLAAVTALWASGTAWALVPLRAQADALVLASAPRGEPAERRFETLRAAAERIGKRSPDDAGLLKRVGDLAADEAGGARDPLTASNPIAALRLMDLAYAQHRAAALAEPLNAEHLVALAGDCLRSARPDLAWSYAERAREVCPRDVSLVAYLAEAFGWAGHPAVAASYLAEAERLAAAAKARAAMAHGDAPEGKARP